MRACLFLLPLLVACSGAPGPIDSGTLGLGGAGGDGGGAGGGTAGAAGGGGGAQADAGSDAGPVLAEHEPNDSAAPGELDSITAPGARQGTIGVANDLDVFMVTLSAGQQWRWTLDAQGSALAPHLVVSEAQNTVPVLAARGTPGGTVALEQLVLKSGSYAIIVRDARNVPSATSANVGSPQHGYLVRGAVSERSPLEVSVPSTTPGTLADRVASALYAFTLAAPTAVTVQVLAQSKVPPSDLDSRLSVFNATSNTWVGTNDNTATSNDSRLTGTLAAGRYWVQVDNVSETASDLRFELKLTTP